MTKDELVVWAAANGIPRDSYSLEGGHPSEALVLDARGPTWAVYYSERGLEQDLNVFIHESDALKYFRTRLEQFFPTNVG